MMFGQYNFLKYAGLLKITDCDEQGDMKDQAEQILVSSGEKGAASHQGEPHTNLE